MFAVIEGKLLGNVISKKGISIDPKRIKAIEQIPLPHNKKGMQFFMGIINFVRRFVLDFYQIVKPLQQMVKQSVQLKWNDLEKNAFYKIKNICCSCTITQKSKFLKGFYSVHFFF